MNETANLTVAGFFRTADRVQVYSAAFPHLYVCMNLFAPVGIPYTSLQKIILPFSLWVWIYILIAFILVLCTIRLMKFPLSRAYINVISIFMGGTIPVNDMPQRNYARLAFAIWMFSTLILRNAYQGSLFEHLQSQIEARPVDTLAKISQYNYSLYVSPFIYNIINASHPNLRKQLSFEVQNKRQSICKNYTRWFLKRFFFCASFFVQIYIRQETFSFISNF